MDKTRDSFFLPAKKQKKENKSDQKKQEFNNRNKEDGNSIKNKRQDYFNKNRVELEQAEEKEGQGKKPFDKKAYRFKKYSKKYKLEQWEEQRKKKILNNYYKELNNESTSGTYKPKTFDEDTTDSKESIGRFVRHPDLIEIEKAENKEMGKRNKKDPYLKAKKQYNKIKQSKLNKQEVMERAKEERNQKLQEYKKKKQERFKKLSKKNKKGQPIMSGRIELLLEKIQQKE